MNTVRNGIATIREYRKAFIAINAVFYGLFAIGMMAAAMFPDLQESSLRGVNEQLDQPGLGTAVSSAYESGNVLWAASITLLVNILVGAFLTTTAPSLFIPFFGIAFTAYRAIQWGFLFAPIGPEADALVPHFITLVVEGQAYVLAAFATWVHGRLFLQPHRFGLTSRRAGYKAGLVATARLYPLVILVLVVGAVYEAIEVIHLVPLFL